MWVVMETTAAGPGGVYLAGKPYDIASAKARAFIEAGAAKRCERLGKDAVPEKQEPIETATAEPADDPKTETNTTVPAAVRRNPKKAKAKAKAKG